MLKMTNNILFDENGRLIIPDSVKKAKAERNRKEEQKQFLEDYSNEVEFDVESFFKNKRFINRIESKRNNYYCYYANGFYLLTTGLKTKTNFNVLTSEEIKAVKVMIHNFNKNSFTIYDLIDFSESQSPKQKRLKYYVDDYKKYKDIEEKEDLRRYLYSFLLEASYILSAMGHLKIDFIGRNVVFTKEKNSQLTNKDILNNINVVGKAETFLLIKNDKFYLTVKEKNLRGSIFPYLIDEIDYLIELINKQDKDSYLDISFLIKEMDYQKRFNEIYVMIIEQNLRNEREEFAYFESRIKAALRIVEYLAKNIEVIKDGRNIKFKRIN